MGSITCSARGPAAVTFRGDLPLFRRGWQAPGQSIPNQWLDRFAPEFILLFGFGLKAFNFGVDGARWDSRQVGSGCR